MESTSRYLSDRGNLQLSSLYCNLISSNNHPSHHLEQSTDMSSAVRPHASYNTTLLAVQIKPKGILSSDLTLYIQLISNSERILRFHGIDLLGYMDFDCS